MERIVFTVTNDLWYDQRMQRIGSSLAHEGYKVLLVGRKRKISRKLEEQPFKQKRLNCFFDRGKAFYIEYNLRLFFYLLFCKADCICAIDLDTIMPVYFASKLKGTKRVYDAHELFCEMKEVKSRPGIYKVWKWVERFAVPKFPKMYTINGVYAGEFNKMYGIHPAVIRNVPLRQNVQVTVKKERYIIYQGAVNEGRSFETLIPAMQQVDCPLHIYGDGNFMNQAKELIEKCGVGQKVILKGVYPPAELKKITPTASIGITLFDKESTSNYLSLANRFFDYIQAGVPQLCVGYPAYKEVNDKYNVAMLIEDLSADNIATQLNELLNNTKLLNSLTNSCLLAAKALNWESEEKVLIQFYHKLFAGTV